MYVEAGLRNSFGLCTILILESTREMSDAFDQQQDFGEHDAREPDFIELFDKNFPTDCRDRHVPINCFDRIMKSALPKSAKISHDMKETVQISTTEFICFVTSEASDKRRQDKDKHKTICGQDLLVAMSALGFEQYLEPLQIFLAKHKESTSVHKLPASSETVTSASAKTTHRASAPSGDAANNIDTEIDKMITAVQSDIENIQGDEFPTRERTNHKWSERAVPFPRNKVNKIMHAEEFICAELERRKCQTRDNCDSNTYKCASLVGYCRRHAPISAKFKTECGLLMGKASEIFAKELAIRSYYQSVEQGKKVIQREHVQKAISSDDKFDFLVDVIPAYVPTKNNATGSQQVEAQPISQGRTITVAQAAAQLEVLRNLVRQQQQQGQESNPFLV